MISSSDIPNKGFMRLKSILDIYPVSKQTWWSGVKSGKYPPAVKLGPRITAWRTENIRELIVRGDHWRDEA